MRMEMISVRIDKKLIETIDKIVANSDKWPDRASFIREAIMYQLKAIPKKRIELKKIHEKALGPNKYEAYLIKKSVIRIKQTRKDPLVQVVKSIDIPIGELIRILEKIKR